MLSLEQINKIRQQTGDKPLTSSGTPQGSLVDDLVVPEVTQLKQPKSIAQTAMDVGTKVTEFLGGKGVAETFGSEIAKIGKSQQEKDIISAEQPTVKQTLGSAAQLGSLFIPVGELAKGAQLGAKALGLGGKAATVAGNVAAGATTGAAFDVGEKLQTGETSGLATAAGTAIPLAGPVVKGVSKLAGEALGATTGAGYGAIKEGLGATVAGGEKAKAFRSALRGGSTPESIVDEAKASLDTIVSNRRNTYLTQLENIAKDKKSLNITPIVEEVGNQLEKFNVGVLDDGTLDFSRSAIRFDNVAQKDITDIVETMKGFGLKEGDRTAVGVDLLKQALSDKYNPSSGVRAFVEAVRKSTRNVLKEVPGYDELAGKYADSTELINDVKKGLSLGDKANVDTAFKKLTSALRQNNEFRQELVQELDSATGGYLSSKIAGQQLSSVLPRGLAKTLTGTGGVLGVASGGIGIIPMLKIALLTSPRLIGELVSGLGFVGNKAKKLTSYLEKNLGKLQAPGDKAVEGIKKDVKAVKKIPNKQGGFIKNPLESKNANPTVGKTVDSTLIEEAKKYKSGKDFYELSGGKINQALRDKGIRGQEQVTKYWEEATGKKSVNGYSMSHRPSESGSGFDITDAGLMPKDFYLKPENYSYGNKIAGKESIDALLKIKGKPNAEVTVYRASPKNELNNGDWISLSKTYAKGESMYEGTKVHSFKVKAKDIQFAGDDINEFGYFPKK